MKLSMKAATKSTCAGLGFGIQCDFFILLQLKAGAWGTELTLSFPSEVGAAKDESFRRK